MKIIFDNGSGGVNILIPAPKFLASLNSKDGSEPTELEKMQFIADKDVPRLQDYKVDPNWVETEEDLELGPPMVPDGDPYLPEYKIVEDSEIPSERVFREAWGMGSDSVEINLAKAKLFSHELRRADRDKKLKPLDDIIAKQIPGHDFVQVEADRQIERDLNATLQTNIDSVVDSPTAIEELTNLLP